MVCCPNCFSDDWLKAYIGHHSVSRGECDFCETNDVQIVDVGELTNQFSNLLSMYVEAEDFASGEPLIDLVQWQWDVFDEDMLDTDAQVSLLQAIANFDWDDDDGEPMLDATDLYMSKSRQSTHTTHRDCWEQFCFDVRQDATTTLPFDDFLAEDFAEFEVTLLAATSLHRARSGFIRDEEDRLPYSGAAIGAPPADKASAGRANIEGQVVLYTADQEKTALAEVRPVFGSYASVGTLTLNREVRILDLTIDAMPLNPFVRESLMWFVEVRSLLDSFSEEMSRPLERNDDETHYIPCQRLAEYIRQSGFDGIRYPSALNPSGTNVVFFDSGIADVTASKLVKITATTFEYEVDETPPMAEQLKQLAEEWNERHKHS